MSKGWRYIETMRRSLTNTAKVLHNRTMDKKKPKAKLTKKEKGFVTDYLATGNGTDAAMKNYKAKNRNTAGVIAHAKLRNVKIANVIQDALSDENLLAKHHQLLHAITLEKLKFDDNESDEVIKTLIENMDGYTLLHIVEYKNKDGEVYGKYAYVKAPDNTVQEKALDKAYKIKGSYAAEKKEIIGDGIIPVLVKFLDDKN